MAYGLMPRFEDEPAGKYPKSPAYCRSCDHKDCEEVRKMRNSQCPVCNERFKAFDAFFDTARGYVHVECMDMG